MSIFSFLFCDLKPEVFCTDCRHYKEILCDDGEYFPACESPKNNINRNQIDNITGKPKKPEWEDHHCAACRATAGFWGNQYSIDGGCGRKGKWFEIKIKDISNKKEDHKLKSMWRKL